MSRPADKEGEVLSREELLRLLDDVLVGVVKMTGKVADYLATTEGAEYLLGKYEEVVGEEEAVGEEKLVSNITLIIAKVIAHSSDKKKTANIFATAEMSKALVEMAGKTRDEAVRNRIVDIISDIVENDSNTTSFATAEMSVFLAKIADEAKEENLDFALAIVDIIFDIVENSSNTTSFATAEMSVFLAKIADKVKKSSFRSTIVDIISCIVENSSNTTSFATAEIEKILVEIGDEISEESESEESESEESEVDDLKIAKIIAHIAKKSSNTNSFATKKIASVLTAAESFATLGGKDEEGVWHNIVVTILDIVSRSSNANIRQFVTAGMVETLVEMANKTNNIRTKGNIVSIIAYVAPRVEDITHFNTPEMAAVLAKIACEFEDGQLLYNAISAIINIAKRDSDHFATQEMAAALAEIANKTKDEVVMCEIAKAIPYIVEGGADNTHFTTPKMAAALLKMAGATQDESVRSEIMNAIYFMVKRSPGDCITGEEGSDTAYLATQEMAAFLIEMANKAEGEELRFEIATAICWIIKGSTIKGGADKAHFTTPEMAAALAGIANKAEGEELRLYIAEAIFWIVEGGADNTHFTTPEMAAALVKMAGKTQDERVRSEIGRAIPYIVAKITNTTPLATQEMAETLVKMAGEAQDERARFDIANTISFIVERSTDDTHFTTPEMAAALVKMAGETQDKKVGSEIGRAILSIAQKIGDTAPLATQEMAAALVKIANKTENEELRFYIAGTISCIVENSTDTAHFTTPEMAAVLIGMANKTKHESLTHQIVIAIYSIADKIADATPLATQDMAEVLVKMAYESRESELMDNILQTIFFIATKSTNTAPLTTPTMASALAVMASKVIIAIIDGSSSGDAEELQSDIVKIISYMIVKSDDKKQFALRVISELLATIPDDSMTQVLMNKLMSFLVVVANQEASGGGFEQGDEFAQEIMGVIDIVTGAGGESFALFYKNQIPLNREAIKANLAQLKEIIAVYNAAQVQAKKPEIESQSLQTLFKRFLSEQQITRGLDAIFEDADKVLGFLRQHPNCISLMDEIAHHHVGACINQPMAGWFKIYSLVVIGQAQTIVDKIEAAKFSLIIAEITEFVKKSEFMVGKFESDELEVEAINLMITTFCKKALEEGGVSQENWPKIQGVPHQEMDDEEWFKESFEVFCKEVGFKILKMTEYEELLSRILIGERGVIFFNTAFPEWLKALEAEIEREKEELHYLSSLFDDGSKDSFTYDELLDAIGKSGDAEEMFKKDDEKKAFAEKYKETKQADLTKLFEESSLVVKITKGDFIKELIKQCMAVILETPPANSPSPEGGAAAVRSCQQHSGAGKQ